MSKNKPFTISIELLRTIEEASRDGDEGLCITERHDDSSVPIDKKYVKSAHRWVSRLLKEINNEKA